MSNTSWIVLCLTVVVLALVWFWRHQRMLAQRAHMMEEAMRNRDLTFRLPTHHMFSGERALQENKYQQQAGTRENNSYKGMAQSGYITNDPDIDYYELYDLQADPHELNNIYGQPGTEHITRKLMRELLRYRKQLQVKE